jgi:poly-gamma-glutamate synthase PgsB/CapB
MILYFYLFITAFIILLLVTEYFWLRKVLNKIPVRILINGTRGKTTTVRILYLVLNQSGKITCAKTTGDEPLLLLPDGNQRVLKRHGPASIRENIPVLIKWQKYHPDAVILECMALQPENQNVLSNRIFKPTHLALTNVKVDHQEIMGITRQAILQSISHSFSDASLHLIPQLLADEFTQFGNQKTILHSYPAIPHSLQLKHIPDEFLAESWGLIITLSDYLGIEQTLVDSVFREEWQQIDDALKFSFSHLNFYFYNLFSVNDSETASEITKKVRSGMNGPVKEIVLLNAREDRPLRSIQFYNFVNEHFREAEIWITGNGRFIFRRLFRKHSGKNMILFFEKNHQIEKRFEKGFRDLSCVYGMGNHQGMEPLLHRLRTGL